MFGPSRTNRFGKPGIAAPRCAFGLPSQTSSSVLPPGPRTIRPTGMSVTWKPVPKMIASTSRSSPSPVITELRVTLSTPPVSSSTLGCESARYQRLDGRMRLQPIV